MSELKELPLPFVQQHSITMLGESGEEQGSPYGWSQVSEEAREGRAGHAGPCGPRGGLGLLLPSEVGALEGSELRRNLI